MIWLSLRRWSYSAGEFFAQRRAYTRRGKWTPFVHVQWRHGWFQRNSTHGA